MNITKITTIREILASNQGSFFQVRFTKKDGSLRDLVGQFGYRPGHDRNNTLSDRAEYATVTENKIDPRTGERAFRTVSLETVKFLSINGKTLYSE